MRTNTTAVPAINRNTLEQDIDGSLSFGQNPGGSRLGIPQQSGSAALNACQFAAPIRFDRFSQPTGYYAVGSAGLREDTTE
jgi:hypothetical protein